MKLSDLISSNRITSMSHDDLMAKIRALRERRMRFVPREKPKAKAAKKAKTTKLEKLIAGMSEEQRAQLLASLEE